ncbi:hypothetical protein B0J14DRAFT_567360 [Halenospora varia]|nr:hypothetical protein B0J14DRAFT_567360 [Halenospora varia]
MSSPSEVLRNTQTKQSSTLTSTTLPTISLKHDSVYSTSNDFVTYPKGDEANKRLAERFALVNEVSIASSHHHSKFEYDLKLTTKIIKATGGLESESITNNATFIIVEYDDLRGTLEFVQQDGVSGDLSGINSDTTLFMAKHMADLTLLASTQVVANSAPNKTRIFKDKCKHLAIIKSEFESFGGSTEILQQFFPNLLEIISVKRQSLSHYSLSDLEFVRCKFLRGYNGVPALGLLQHT